MIHCKDCKWWKSTSDRTFKDFNGCSNPKFHYGYNVKKEEVSDDSIVIEMDEGWGCFTGPNFGCIHGELITT